MAQAALVCRGCLATDTKLFDFNQNKLKDHYMELIGSPFQTMESPRLPQTLCSFCNALLLKCVSFKDQCLRSQAVLELINESDLTAAYIGTVDRDHYNLSLNLSISNPVIIDCDITEDDIPIETLEDDLGYEEYLEEGHGCEEYLEEEVEVKLEDDVVVENINYESVYDGGSDDVQVSTARQKKPFNVKEFQSNYNVSIDVLSKEQQILEIYERKKSAAFVNSKNACNDCGKFFLSSDKLRNHFMMAHNPNIGHYICELCNSRYDNRSSLRRHLFSHKYKFNCNKCHFLTMCVSSAKNHYYKHQGVQFCCEHCGKSFSMNTSYLSHLRKIHPSQDSWCTYCGESFLGDIGLRNHKKLTHYDVQPNGYVCLTCDANFMNDEALQNHNSTSCSEHSCFQCGSGFVEEQFLRYHLLSHRKKPLKSLRCGICGVVFDNSLSLNTHLEWSKGQCCGINFCTVCGDHFDTKEEVEDHVLKMHLNKKFQCAECGSVFLSSTKLNQHTKKMHKRKNGDTRRLIGNRQWGVTTEGGETVIAGEGGLPKQEAKAGRNCCEFCGKVCPNIIALKIHRRVHTGEKPYKCPFCSKCFTTELLCKQHIRVHTGERPFKCLYCPKSFKSKPAVNRHMLIHTGERKHICTLCNKAFRTSTDVKTHIKYVHMKVPAAPRDKKPRGITKNELKHICMLCKKAFLTSSEAKFHIKQAHMKFPAPPVPVVVGDIE